MADKWKPTKEQYAEAAKANGWVYSPAHDGWVHPEECDERGYQVQKDAEDACWLHEITPLPPPSLHTEK